jgi:hypothetical protein
MTKPHLTLMRGRDTQDPEALARFWAALKGEEYTPELVEEFRIKLAEARERLAGEEPKS